MKLQKIILCVAVALTAFGASLGLLEIGSYFGAVFEPSKIEIKTPEPLASPVYAPARIPEFKPPAFTPTVETKPEIEPEDWDKTGYYYTIDDRTKGFADFEWLQLDTSKYDQKLGKVVKAKPKGWIDAANRYFQLSSINITGSRISLVSEKQKGISYRFDGKFIEEEEVKYKDEDGEEITDKAVLKGRLTKWRNGVKIAEANVKFGFTVGC
ncbi:MAG TPA: hypothetical protein VNB22_12920 [Pyrinomonadaceae bacterium]|nr:hypothetical protein [Pyrinomonadaceae bacterium]